MPDTANPRSHPFRLGELTVYPDRNTITGPDGARRIEPMSMRLLLLLAQASPRTVSRDEIVEGLWEGRVVSDDAVTKQISKLRAALGDDPRKPRLLQTVAKVGVRLLAPAAFASTLARKSSQSSMRMQVWWNLMLSSSGNCSV